MSAGDSIIEDLARRLQEQIDLIETAIVKTRRNELMNIVPVDREVASICRQIALCERETAQTLEMKMVEMITKLDELAAELKDYKERSKGTRE